MPGYVIHNAMEVYTRSSTRGGTLVLHTQSLHVCTSHIIAKCEHARRYARLNCLTNMGILYIATRTQTDKQ